MFNTQAALKERPQPLHPHQDRVGKNALSDLIDNHQIQPHFHPVVDLITASVMGFEILSRGVPPLVSPLQMFTEAKNSGMTWELEKACRRAALRKISLLSDELRSALFFINVSPDIFSDPRFIEHFTETMLKKYGIDQKQIVIEITEEKSFADFMQFEKLVAHYANQGFKIAIDDFGSGYSGLITLIASTPHYMKLDMALVRDIHKHDYKQKLVKAIIAFASSVNARLIAEGVETLEELEVLVRYGVRYVQGFIFGRPESEPYNLTEEWKSTISGLVARYDLAKVEVDERIGSLVIRPMTIPKGTMNCQTLDQIFKKATHLDHVVILDGENIAGMITRQLFYGKTGGAFGYELFHKKPIESVCKQRPLIVDEKITVTSLANLAMDRLPDDLYDPVIIIDGQGRFMGTVTMKQVMTKSVELEVRSAMGVNPLTNLPGNNIIHRWIHEVLAWPEYSVVYGDLDNFKVFNDVYGFLMGDEMLMLTSLVMTEWCDHLPEGTRLGHLGGDDFVIVSRGLIGEEEMAALCSSFDQAKLDLFKHGDIERGYLEAHDRQGNPVRLPLVTLSLAVIDSGSILTDPHPALFSECAASLKKKVKKLSHLTGRSNFAYEQRKYPTNPVGPEISLH